MEPPLSKLVQKVTFCSESKKLKPLLHPIVRAHIVLVTEKNQTLKLNVQFYNRISLRLHRPHNENWHVHYSPHARSMATNTSMSQGKFARGLDTCIILASVTGAPQSYAGFACAICYAHMYLCRYINPLCGL